MITFTLVAIVVSLFAYLLRMAIKINEHWEKRGIKHLKPLPFFGNNLPMVLGTKSPQMILEELYEKHPNEQLLGYYDFMQPKLYMRDADLIEKVLIKDFAHFTDHGLEIDVKTNPRDEQLFVMNGTRWRALRVKLSPIFTSGKLKEMFSTMTSVGTNMLEYLKGKETEEIDAKDLMGLYSMDVISSAVFGMDPATIKNPQSEFRKFGLQLNDQNIVNIIRIWIAISFPKLAKALGLSFQNHKLTNYFCNIIQNAFKVRKEKGIHRNDFIQMMIQLKEKGKVEIQSWDTSDDYLKSDVAEPTLEKFEITDDLLMAQGVSFLVAGFEGTAIFMAYTMFELTQQQDLQNRVREEVQEQVKLHGGLTYDAVKNMKLLECSLKETQRFYPALPSLFRVCTKRYELPNGYVIEKGDAVNIPVAAVHMDPNNFPDPKVYKPERFLDPIKQCTFMPFGEGPRICIAMRYAMLVMQYGLALFFMNYKIKLSPKTSVPLKINNRSLGAMPKEKILLHLEKVTA